MLRPSIYKRNLFDDFFDDFFNFPEFDNREMDKAEKKIAKTMRAMKTDVKEKRDSYELEMDLPGFAKDDIRIALDNGYLTVQAEKNMEYSDNQDGSEKDEGRYIRRERYSGSCSRSFYVGENVRDDDIKAEFKHGILKLSVRKVAAPAVEEKKYIQITG